MKRYNIYAILLTVLLAGCYSTNKVSVQNLSNIYRSDSRTLHPKYYVYNINDSLSILYYKIDESELLYIRKAPADSFYASVRVACRVSPNYDATTSEDTTSVTLKFASATNTKSEYAVGPIPLKIMAGSSHLLTVTMYDEVSKHTDVSYLDVNKTDKNSAQNFLVRDPVNGYIIFPGYVDSAVTYAFSFNRPVNRFYVHYYHRNFPIAAPPFSTIENQPFQYKPDSSFEIKPSTSGVAYITLKSEGFYHIMADTNDRNGLTLYRYPKHFPAVGAVYQMADPLRYITSNDEYEKITGDKNMKQAIDAFWLNTAGGTKERAKALIRNYYNRVQDANTYFTSYEEGWKTDRGMIYIIYGAPSIIYRNSNSETWTYGEDKSYMALTFTFVKVNNPFTNNDYSLQRMQQYRNLWYNAVDVWREGRVY